MLPALRSLLFLLPLVACLLPFAAQAQCPATPQIYGPGNLCSGQTITLTILDGAGTRQYSSDGGSIWQGYAGSTLSVSTPGVYLVRNIANACTTTSSSFSVLNNAPFSAAFTDAMPFAQARVPGTGNNGAAIATSVKGLIAVSRESAIYLYQSAADNGPASLALANCSGLAFTPEGDRLLVAQSNPSKVSIYNVATFHSGASPAVTLGGTTGSAMDQFDEPGGMVVTPDGRLFISDRNNHRVLGFNKVPTASNTAANFAIGGTAGRANNRFNSPRGLAITNDGRLLVADQANERVVIFSGYPASGSSTASGVIGQTNLTDQVFSFMTPYNFSTSYRGQMSIPSPNRGDVRFYNSVTAGFGFTSAVFGNGSNSNNKIQAPWATAFLPDGRMVVNETNASSTSNNWYLFGDAPCIYSDLGLGITSATNSMACTNTNTYTLTLTNYGSTDVEEIVVYAALPYGTTSQTNTPSAGSYNSNAGIWTVNLLAAGQSATLTMTGDFSPLNSQSTVTVSAGIWGGRYQDDSPPNNGVSISTPISVVAQPEPTISSDVTVCPGQSTTLTATNGNSYSWSTGATTASISVAPTTTTTYTVTVARANGCNIVKQVTVNVIPTGISYSGDNRICQGQSITLSAVGAGPWLWSNGATTSSITVSAGGIYSLTQPCTTSYAAVYMLNAPPHTLSPNPGFCKGNYNTLTATAVTEWASTLAGIYNTYGVVFGNGPYVRYTNLVGVAVGPDGNYYTSEQTGNIIRKYNVATGDVTLYAGESTGGAGNANNTDPLNARFSGPAYIEFNSKGNLLIADVNNHRIRCIAPNGAVTTFAGSGTNTTSDGTGTAASFASPYGLAIDKSDNIYIAQRGGTLRKISSAGVVTTLATGLGSLYDLVVDQSANPRYLYINTPTSIIRFDLSNNTSELYAGHATESGNINGNLTDARFTNLRGIHLMPSGLLYVTDFGTHFIKVINTAAPVPQVAVFAGSTQGNADGLFTNARMNQPTGITCDLDGNIVTVEWGALMLRKYTLPLNIAWSNGLTASTITATKAGNYAVTLTNAWGCTRQAAAQVTIDSINVADGRVQLCQGDSITLMASGSGPWLWNTGATTQAIKVKTGGTYQVNFPSGCSSSKDIYIQAAPPVSISSWNTAICNNAPVQMTATTTVAQVEAVAGTYFTPGNTNGAASSALVRNPTAVAVGPNGKWYFSDQGNDQVKIYDPATQQISLFAGSTEGFANNDNPTLAQFNNPMGLAFDSRGNLYVADELNRRVRKIDPQGRVTTLAGSGANNTVDGIGTAAQLSGPNALAIDDNDVLYVSQTNGALRRIDVISGQVTTLGTTGITTTYGVAVDRGTNPRYIYQSTSSRIHRYDLQNNTLSVYAGTATAAVINGHISVAAFNAPRQMTMAPGGLLYIASVSGVNGIRVINTLTDTVTTLTGATSGNVNGSYSAARFNGPHGLALDNDGNLAVVEYSGHVLRKISLAPSFTWTNGVTTSAQIVATSGSYTATATNIWGCTGQKTQVLNTVTPLTISTPGSNMLCEGDSLLLTASGTGPWTWSTGATTASIYVKTGGTYTVSPDGACYGGAAIYVNSKPAISVSPASISICAGTSTTLTATAATGYVATLAGAYRVTGSANGAGADARFRNIFGVAIGPNGHYYIADHQNHQIRKYDPSTGQVSLFAGNAGAAGGYIDHLDPLQARFTNPAGLTFDWQGNLIVTELLGHRVRRISPQGQVTTVAGSGTNANTDGVGTAASFSQPCDVVADPAGNLYVCQRNGSIRKVTPNGTVTTLGTTGAVIFGITIEPGANPRYFYLCTAVRLYRFDLTNNQLSVYAGTGTSNLANGPLLSAAFGDLRGMSMGSNGVIYATDNGNNCIRLINTLTATVSTPTNLSFGNADGDFSTARFHGPHGCKLDEQGNLVVVEWTGQIVRKMTFPPDINWSNGGTGTSISASAAGTYTATASSAWGCTSQGSSALTVKSVFSPTLNLTDGSSACEGNAVAVTNAATCTGCSWLWTNGATTPSTTVAAGANSYGVTVTNGNGCQTVVPPMTITSIAQGSWLGNSSSWTDPANWCGGVPASSANVVIPTGRPNFPAIDGNVQITNLTIPAGQSLSIGSGHSLTLLGNQDGGGAISGGCNTVLQVVGSARQIIGPVNVGTLIVNNSSDVELTDDLSICTALTLSTGNLVTNDKTVTLATTALTPTESDATRIIGRIRAMGRTVGTGSLNMLGVQLGTGTDDLDTVYVERNEAAASVSTRQGIGQTWKIRAHRQPGAGRLITLNWPADATNGNDMSTAQLWRRPEGSIHWLKVGSTQNLNPSNGYYSMTATTTGFSDWTVSSDDNPLPVTLLSFTGRRQGGFAQLRWSTVNEVINKGFIIERSLDNSRFDSVGFVAGNGTSQAQHRYQWEEVNQQASYYRLVQVDIDGRRTPSHTLFIGVEEGQHISLYPNPSRGSVMLAGLDRPTTVILRNSLGQTVWQGEVKPHELVNLSQLPAGIYSCLVGEKTIKLVIE